MFNVRTKNKSRISRSWITVQQSNNRKHLPPPVAGGKHPKMKNRLMKYFAYGSNMNAERMKSRGIDFTSRVFARLDDYKLVFNKKASGGNKTFANIESSEGSHVEGALYEFPDEQIGNLDRCEGHPYHYKREELTVLDQDGQSVSAMVYIAHPDKIASDLLPDRDYLDHLLQGEDLLSASYYDDLARVKTL